jgi:thioredoxin-like negative regulator of GroEL
MDSRQPPGSWRHYPSAIATGQTAMSEASGKAASPGPRAQAAPAAVAPGGMFRRVDWWTFLVTFAAVWTGYYLTLAPELTLEDSGELATASFYAGIPHPPGYPVWTIYTWLWTVLLPIKNVAWRVALGEATGGALAAGLLGLLVSRGSSLMMEGIEDLKAVAGRWEGAICMVSGFVAGMLLGFNGYMWSQSVIVEVYSFSVASFMVVLLCLLRWIYAPHQRRYLYYALFFHGICFTNHQTLIVAAMGIEVAIAAADFRLGRYLFLGNGIIYLAGLILKQHHILTALEQNPAVFVIFNVVGISSLAAYVWFAIRTKETFGEYCFDASQAAVFLSLAAVPALGWLAWLLALVALASFVKFARDTRKLGREWLVVLLCGLAWVLGAGFYFYMPLAGMTNPPMEWGYPRTVEGFIHAFTRGQYDKANPSDFIHNPGVFLMQLKNMGLGIIDEFNWVYAFLALVPFLFFRKMHQRERAWLIGISSIYLCLGVLLLILLNPPADRASQELNRVFFTASHTLIALLVGYGLTLAAAYMATHYENFRSWGLIGGAVAVALSIYSMTELIEKTYFGEAATVGLSSLASMVVRAFTNKDQYALPIYAGIILIGMAGAYLAAVAFYRHRAPLAITLAIFALMPIYSIMTHWSDNEQRNHWFGYWFGHDMFTPPFQGADSRPLYPEMTRNAVLFGGTDPGRFCPTYMVFCDSFIPHPCQPKEDQGFDRRDVYVITQNALADGTYLSYIRAQYNRSTQIDPPFFQELLPSQQLGRAMAPLDRFFGGLGDRVERRRRASTSWLADKELIDLPGLAAKLRPTAQQDPLSKYLYENLSPATQQLLSGKGDEARLRRSLAEDLNRLLERELDTKRRLKAQEQEKDALSQQIADGSKSESVRQRLEELRAKFAEASNTGSFYESERFKQVELSEYLADFIKQNPQSWTRIRLNRLLLEAAYPKEIARSLGGVYPDREISTPTSSDWERCYSEYLADAGRRLQLNQLEPGESVIPVGDNRIQISGQVSVMNINGLLTKVIFDQNPKNEFFVEESFPLKWMYRHLSPFGIIMKINRQPLRELTEEIVRKDHEFWTQYSERLIGNWITYDTSVKDIAAFVEKVYLRRDFAGFKGDRKFVRDDQGQKAFSKLRSSIAGVYAWRIKDPDNQDPVIKQRMIKEADFAFRQAFAFCPYSPEAAFHYVNLLLSLQRVDDALLIASTCQKLDPYSRQAIDVVKHLQEIKKQQDGVNPHQSTFAQMEQAVQDNPTNFQAAFNLAAAYLQAQQPARALEVLDRVLNHPQADANALRMLLLAYASIGNSNGLERTVARLEAFGRTHPTDFSAAIGLAEGYRQLHKPEAAIRTLDQVVSHPQVDAGAVLQAVQQYAAMTNYQKLEAALGRLTQLSPDSPEVWYDLAALKTMLGKPPEAISALRQSFDLSAKRLKRDAKAHDLHAAALQDSRFDSLRQMPEFKQLSAPR